MDAFGSIGNIKPLFTCTPVGASPHPARVPLRHRVPSPNRASGWPALAAAGQHRPDGAWGRRGCEAVAAARRAAGLKYRKYIALLTTQ